MTSGSGPGVTPLTGQVAIITGAGSGIGRATAIAFAELGVAGLALFDISADGLAETIEQLADHDVDAVIHTVDVSDATAMSDAFAAVIDRFGRLDHMINNAAIMTTLPGFPTAGFDQIDRVVDINIRGVLIGTKLAHAYMAVNGGGSIVSVASGAGKVPIASDPLYGATKAAVIMLTRASAAPFADVGVRINAVCPGVVDTPILQTGSNTLPGNAAMLARTPTLPPRAIADAIVALSVDATATGQTPSVKA